MFPRSLLAEIAGSRWFCIEDAPYLVVDTDLRILAVNSAYQAATDHPSEALVGELLFEAFPDNPADPLADGVDALSASLESVFRDQRRDYMGVQQYDIPDRTRPGEFLYKVWAPVNTPITAAGRVVGALHHVDDVTAVFGPGDAGIPWWSIRRSARALARQFPGLPYEAVLGILTHSHRLVQDAVGTPMPDKAEELAVLRLEVLAGHPRLGPVAPPA